MLSVWANVKASSPEASVWAAAEGACADTGTLRRRTTVTIVAQAGFTRPRMLTRAVPCYRGGTCEVLMEYIDALPGCFRVNPRPQARRSPRARLQRAPRAPRAARTRAAGCNRYRRSRLQRC